MTPDPVALALRYALSPATEPPPPDRPAPNDYPFAGSATGEVLRLKAEIARLNERIRELLFQIGGEP